MTDERRCEPCDASQLCRRRFLTASGVVLIPPIAGCSGSQSGTETSACPAETSADLSGQVPEEYHTAHAQVEDYKRDPDDLISKEKAEYQREPKFENSCETCATFIPDKNGDCLGACIRVEGLIDPTGWCEYYSDASGVSW